MEGLLGLGPTEIRIVFTVALVLALWVVKWLVSRRAADERSRYSRIQGINFAATVVFLLLLGVVWFERFQDLFTVLSLVAVGLTIVFKEFILNLVSSVIIQWRDLFTLGDRIQIGNYAGDVVMMGISYITLTEVNTEGGSDSFTGRVLKIPNSLVLTTPVVNYTKGSEYVWGEVSVQISSASNWREARGIAEEIARERFSQSEQAVSGGGGGVMMGYLLKEAAPLVFMGYQEGKITLTLRYLAPTRERRKAESEICAEILSRFEQYGDIELA